MTTLVSQTPSPISLQRAKTHLGISGSDLDNDIDAKLRASLLHIEGVTGRTLRETQTFERWDSGWCNPVSFPILPVKSVTSVEYVLDDVLTAVAADQYELETSETGRNFLRFRSTFTAPSHDDISRAVKYVYVAGWSSAAAIPPDGLEAVLTQLSIMCHATIGLKPNELSAYKRVLDSQIASLSWGYA